TGAYTFDLAAHGTYVITVLAPAGSEYKSVPGIPITFGLGEVRRYDAVVHRLGRIDLSVLQPDPQTGALVAAGSTTVTVAGPSPSTVTTPDHAVAVITKLNAGSYTLSA